MGARPTCTPGLTSPCELSCAVLQISARFVAEHARGQGVYNLWVREGIRCQPHRVGEMHVWLFLVQVDRVIIASSGSNIVLSAGTDKLEFRSCRLEGH